MSAIGSPLVEDTEDTPLDVKLWTERERRNKDLLMLFSYMG